MAARPPEPGRANFGKDFCSKSTERPGQFGKDFYRKSIRKLAAARRSRPGPVLVRISIKNLLGNGHPAAGASRGQFWYAFLLEIDWKMVARLPEPARASFGKDFY